LKKKSVIRSHQYIPLAEKLWEFLTTHYSNEPTPEQYTIIIGALEAVKLGILGRIKEQGQKVVVVHNKEKELEN
jgi:hypothetical protein